MMLPTCRWTGGVNFLVMSCNEMSSYYGLIYLRLIRAYSPFRIHTHCNGGHWGL
jgi:hypothetical protein